ncbi:MAG: hypothetical protein NTU66_02920 [Elusimicrobia bacterium]|nr:hypothetical protein [Elusimicrobiota bacterium]
MQNRPSIRLTASLQREQTRHESLIGRSVPQITQVSGKKKARM